MGETATVARRFDDIDEDLPLELIERVVAELARAGTA